MTDHTTWSTLYNKHKQSKPNVKTYIANTFQSCILWDSGMFAFGFQPCPPSPVINVSSFLPGKNKGIASVGVEL